MIKRLAVLLGFILSSALSLYSGHLVAGTMHYTCVRREGNSITLRVVLRVIRDCRIEDPIGFFDSSPRSSITGTVSIYAGTETRPAQTIILSNPAVTQVFPVPTYTCLEPPREYCLELGEYNMDIVLPVINESYYIIYQRCCRSQIIQNITSPEATGVSYWLEITPAGQRACNSSPLFQGFPPLTTCVDQPFQHTLGINDPDQDQMRIKVSAPYKGGGPSNPPNIPNGIAPDPDAPPPYDTVRYLSGFASDHPFGMRSSLILQQQRILSGFPAQLGTYLIGLSIEDYRQDQLLSRSSVDMQVNVVSCAPLVQASVVGRANPTRDTFFIEQCGAGPLSIVNNSTLKANIKNWHWQWDINQQDPGISTWNADFSHLPIGTYFGRLSLNALELCKDTVHVQVNVFPEVTADFLLPSTTCEHTSLRFIPDINHTSPLRSTVWSVSPGVLRKVADTFVYLFPRPGNYQVNLEVTDQNGCIAQAKHDLLYAPLDTAVLDAQTSRMICLPDTVNVNPFVFLNSDLYKFIWDYGLDTSTLINPRVVFDQPGVYDLKYQITSLTGCALSGTLLNHLQAFERPQIDLSVSVQSQQSSRNLELTAKNSTTETLDFTWWINTNQIGSGAYQTYQVTEFGTYVVRLQAINSAGCTTEVSKQVSIEPLVQFYLPNVFSPNGDGFNDGWRPEGFFEGVQDLEIYVFDRWGNLLFFSTDPQMNWDGRFKQQPLPPGVYAAVVKYTNILGKKQLISEAINLIR